MADSDDLFASLENESFFLDFVITHFSEIPWEASQLFPCTNTVSKERVQLAYQKYMPCIATYKLLLESENPDQYKRSGALLNALYKSRIITDVCFDSSVYGKLEDMEGVPPLGLSHGDCLYHSRYPKFYRDFHNEVMSFDLAYRCCAVHEDDCTPYTFNYLENVCHYLHTNDNLNVDSLSMMFRSLMHQGLEASVVTVKAKPKVEAVG